jgi:hypothetical protein
MIGVIGGLILKNPERANYCPTRKETPSSVNTTQEQETCSHNKKAL